MSALGDVLRALADHVDEHGLETPSATDSISAWVDPADCEVSERAIRHAIAAGELAAYRVGRRLLVRREELDAWIARPEHRVKPSSSTSTTTDHHDEHIRRLAEGRGRAA